MKSALFSIASVAFFVASVSTQSTVTINTPANAIVCEPLQFTWSGGSAPYFLTLHPGATPNGAALITFGTVNSTSFTWAAVNEPAGTSLGATIIDANGVTGQTAAFTVLAGTNTSCLNTTATGSSGPAASTPLTSSTSSSASSPTATTPTSTKSTSSSSSSSPKSSSNAAMPIDISHGAAGVFGLIIAAVLV